MAESDIEVVRQGYVAFEAGDMSWLDDHLHDEVVWVVPGSNPFGGTYRGKDEVLGYFARFFQATAGTFHTELHDVLGNDRHVVALVGARAADREGRWFEWGFAQIFHFREGKVAESWTLIEEGASVDEFLNRLPG